ncbi:MAG: ATP-binding protein [Kiloniellales bacterium]|nr:ATP-binding protein [Kiloniellales bacterium]
MIRRTLSAWVPNSLAGQMIALLLLALVAAQGVTLAIYLDERRHALRAAERAQVASRLVSVVRLLGDTPPELSERITRTASGPRLGFWLAAESAVDASDPEALDRPLQRRLGRLLADSGSGQILVRLEDSERFLAWRKARREARREARRAEEGDSSGAYRRAEWRKREYWEKRRHRLPLSLTISVRLADGRWLNAATLVPFNAPAWAWPSLLSMGLMALAILVIVVFSVRRITRPLRTLAAAADRFGRGQDGAPPAEAGPEEVRRTIHAFNDMQERLRRFVADRTGMLAAISHDLRTPITTLRLRAEFIEDPEIRDKILETLAEMQQMTEATLAFLREDAAREDSRQVDLAALVQSLCDDLADAGGEVAFAGAGRTPYLCRPVALKRALSNLIENAVAYGARARVALRQEAAELWIVVDDDGPGIPAERREEIFQPFVRLEDSRSRETGGAGLGLAIARSIARGHGGDVTLENRPEGGLRAILRLPKAGQG